MSEDNENAIAGTRKVRRRSARATALPPEADTAVKFQATTESPIAVDKRANRTAVPEEVLKRFVQVGKHYHFRDGTRAFTDSGTRLTTPSENTEVIRTLITIAKARQWKEITVQGTERFRRDAWLAGRAAGLEVQGFQPSPFEQERLVRALAGKERIQQTPENRRGSDSQSKRDELITGTLLDHGRAHYKDSPREAMSYFVKIETRGKERVIWGVDLERALRESLSRPQLGDEVGLRAVAREAVKVRTPTTDGKLTSDQPQTLAVHRNRWIVEKWEFLNERAAAAKVMRDPTVDPREAMKTRPELAGAYLQLHLAELVAKKKLGHTEDRTVFLERVRSALADSVHRGEPLPAIRLRETSTERSRKDPERESVLVR